MKKYIVFLFLMTPFIVQASEVDCENAVTTYDMNICARKEMEEANAKMEKYYSKAKERYLENDSVVDLLVKSQEAWMIYRKAHCNSVYEIWARGTIRGVMFAGCMLRLTRQRTYIIWETYLTYMDSTPALLPEPK